MKTSSPAHLVMRFAVMSIYVKQRASIGYVASKLVIAMLTTVRLKEGHKPSIGVIYHEPPRPKERYRLQLLRLRRALHKNEYVILQHDIARPHVSKQDKASLETVKSKVPHIFSRYHMFRSLAWSD